MGRLAKIVIIGLYVAWIVGQIMCFSKMISCNWEPIGKAEAIYTVSFFTGIGGVVGYIDIEDK
jgi:hypothetical protein